MGYPSEVWDVIDGSDGPAGGLDAVLRADNDASYAMYRPRAERVVACVNALADIDDPRGFIAAVVDALWHTHRVLLDLLSDSRIDIDAPETAAMLRANLQAVKDALAQHRVRAEAG